MKYRYLDFKQSIKDLIKILFINAGLGMLLILIKGILILPNKTILLIIYLLLYTFIFGLLYFVLLTIFKVHPFIKFSSSLFRRGKENEGDIK